MKYCDGSFESYLNEIVCKTLKNGKRIKVFRKSLLSEEILDKHRGEEVKAKGLLRHKLSSAKEVWEALLEEYESQSIFDKIYCLHDLFFTKL